jgi:hypothetical protein
MRASPVGASGPPASVVGDMLHPVGPQPPSVYWRRRLLLLASAIVLIVLVALTANALLGGGGGNGGTPAAAQHSTRPSSTQSTSPPATGALSGAAASSGPETATSTPGGTTSAPASSSAAPARCTPAKLSVQAVVGKDAYAVGDQPVLTLQVTDTGTAPCVQDVADSQIVLRVYNGASRVWGSHDCKVEPGVQDRTLEPGKPAGFSIVWSGLSSQPACAGTRQRVGAGTYTLYAALSGHEGKAAQFTIK